MFRACFHPDAKDVNFRPEVSPSHSVVKDTRGDCDFVRVQTMSDTHYIWAVFAPVVWLSGCVGNLVIIAVIRRGGMRFSTTSAYVTSIAVFDLLTLVSGLVNEWLKVCLAKSQGLFSSICTVVCSCASPALLRARTIQTFPSCSNWASYFTLELLQDYLTIYLTRIGRDHAQ